MFEHGSMRWLLLSLIAAKPSHGYELMKQIEDKMGGTYQPSPGVIYPTLTLLEDLGAVSVTSEGGKKRFEITDEGLQLLEANREAVERIELKIKAQGHRSVRPEAVVRALEAFRSATHHRLTQDPPLSGDEIAALAEIIEAAASKVRSL